MDKRAVVVPTETLAKAIEQFVPAA
jgi:hypothetical protein